MVVMGPPNVNIVLCLSLTFKYKRTSSIDTHLYSLIDVSTTVSIFLHEPVDLLLPLSGRSIRKD